MKQRIFLSIIFILTSVMSWGYDVNEIFFAYDSIAKAEDTSIGYYAIQVNESATLTCGVAYCNKTGEVTIPGSVYTRQAKTFKVVATGATASSVVLSQYPYPFKPESGTITKLTFSADLSTVNLVDFRECAATELVLPKTVSTITETGSAIFPLLNKVTIQVPSNLIYQKFKVVQSAEGNDCIVSADGTDIVYACTNLKSIVIPKKVTKIDNHAFEFCDNLTNITFLGDVRPTNVEGDVTSDNESTDPNNKDHHFGDADISSVDFLKNNVTIYIRHNATTVNSFKDENSYWKNAKGTIVSFDATSGTKTDGNSFEYLFMSPSTLGVVASKSTNYTTIVPVSVVLPASGTNYDGTDISGGDGNTYPIRLIADYAFEDMNEAVKEVEKMTKT